ncbi:carbohydrate-binding family 6 protein [Synoicihabitans lomoniglobus]|uniref:carbohydrate-binding family 6 protein n=1 Tax=Synoicihabitans lomoniglobus TaxID=2909285 RepID=UPI002ED24504|nr:carbohydrate-binding family 6 protein [Opitutaceae bacterium LMO-M01]
MRLPLRFAVFWLSCFLSHSLGAETVWLAVENGFAPIEFGAQDVTSALEARGHEVQRVQPGFSPTETGGVLVNLSTFSGRFLEPEAFELTARNAGGRSNIVVGAGDAAGLMYGGLELAEQIRLYDLDGVKPTSQKAHVAMRGVKFNIPLDVRTPSYSDMSDAAQENIATVWDWDFWTEYLDTLARYRFNYVSLWSLHPFPSLVKVPGYEDIALDDVQRSTVTWAEDYPTIATGYDAPEILENVEVVKRITIDEKIDFWRRVMRYAKDRNIDFYVITWNVFTYGTDGKYGITDAMDNPVTVDYFRKSVKQLLLTYPLLRGVGLTTGENMRDVGFQEKEDWAFATYGQGVLDAVAEQPGRQIRFIHRQHQTKAQDIAATFAPLVKHPDVDFIFSFKYAQAHVMSSTTQTFHESFVPSLGDELKTIWTQRNDDAYLLRWGAPNFFREFINNIPSDVTQGMYYGSDQWVWGRDWLTLDRGEGEPRELEIKKHWYHWLTWGRLGYNPDLGNDRFVALLGERFPQANAEELFNAWQNASMVYPLTTGFHWGQFDFQWYIEACRSRPGPAQTESGFHDVNRFITLGVHPGTDNVAIPEYVAAMQAGATIDGTSPLDVATALHRRADAALEALPTLDETRGTSVELDRTLNDIRLMAYLGKYYAFKIHGATELALFRATGERARQQSAVAALTEAQTWWLRYTTLSGELYRNPFWTNRVGIVDWVELNAEVARDIQIAQDG